MRFPILGALALAALGGCATTQSFSGTVAPAGEASFATDAAAVQVMLVDESSGDVLATESYPVEGRMEEVPFRFSPASPLAADGRYAVRARVISRTGAVLYQSAQGMPVATSPSGSIAVRVQPAQRGS